MSHADSSARRGRLRWVALTGLVAAVGLCLMPGAAAAKKKDRVKVMDQNLYIGGSLGPVVAQALESHTDGVADAAGTLLNNVDTNDFRVRAKNIAKFIQKKKVDLVGLQEVALWRAQVPSDGGGPSSANPNAALAQTVIIDYIDALLDTLNKKALSKKECKAFREKHPGKQCYRGYRLAVTRTGADAEQPADTDHNNGPDGQTFDITTTSGAADIGKWLLGNDDVGLKFGEPPSPPFPTDANFDSTGPTGSGPYAGDPTGNTPDPVSTITGAPGADCNDALTPTLDDNNPARGPAFGESTATGNWPFDGYDRDIDPAEPGVQSPVCLFHGVDEDGRLTNRDVIIARKGAGVKTSNPQSGNYQNQAVLSAFGGAQQLSFNRGWTSVDASVRGKKFHFVNTHLEDLENGTVREDQASELFASGGPASAPNTVLVGDINSDPSIQPGDPVNDAAESNIAIDRLTAAGFRFLAQTGPTWGHAQILNNPADNALSKRIDYIMTNSAGINSVGTTVFNRFSGGLWQSDHAGLLNSLKVPGGKKK